MFKHLLKMLLIIISLFLSKNSFPQSVNVPLNHWAYNFLERLETRGCFSSLLLRARPISRNDLAGLLAQIDKNCSEKKVKLSKSELDLFEQLKGEFHEELDNFYGLFTINWDIRLGSQSKERLTNVTFGETGGLAAGSTTISWREIH